MVRVNEDRPPKRSRGRPLGETGTRDAVLDAARMLFAELGYEGTSIRAIAAEADVDSALVHHYFGDKATLFANATANHGAILERLAHAFAGDAAGLGHRVTVTYLRAWEEPETRLTLLAQLRSASTFGEGVKGLQEHLAKGLLDRGDSCLGGTAGRHTAIAASYLFGVAVARHVSEVPAIAALPLDTLISEIAPTIHQQLTPAS